MSYEHEVIFCIVNAGFSDAVMDAAKEFGARGGTVIRARGTANSVRKALRNNRAARKRDRYDTCEFRNKK